MLAFQDKRRIRQIIYSRAMIVFLAVVFGSFAWASFHMYGKESDTREKRNIALNEEKVLGEKQSDLLTRLERLKTDRGIEEEIRKKFRVVKEGEGVIIVVDQSAAAAAGAASEEDGFLERLIRFFKR